MQRQLSLTNSDEAVSPVIGTILILAIMLTVTGTMLAWGIPQIQQNEAYAIYTSAQNNLLNFDADLDHVIFQGEGASRTSTISFSSGTFVQRSNLDEIRYYYTTVPWSNSKIVGVKSGSESFAIMDNLETVDNYTITLVYPNGTQWTGDSKDSYVSGFPALEYGVKATYTSTTNSTQVGGFFIYGTDSLSYKYASVSGVFKMRMLNGGIAAKEPGGQFYVSSQPLTRSVMSEETDKQESYDSLTFYQTDYNMSSSIKSLMAGNYVFDIRNQGGDDNSLNIYSLRIAFDGDSSDAFERYYVAYKNFEYTQNYFSKEDSMTVYNNELSTSEIDVEYSQSTPFDFRLLERTIHVKFSLR
ncbi:hypothetical protein OAO35_00585 [Euryarchaeota archaeon]|nr:hypothetical protein [Euryarchaeota archaeon]